MEQFSIADKPTLDGVDEKIGKSTDTANAGGTTGFSLLKFLTGTWTAAKAAFLDVSVSSRADSADVGTRANAAVTTVNTTNTMIAMQKGTLNQVNSLVSKSPVQHFQRQYEDEELVLPSNTWSAVDFPNAIDGTNNYSPVTDCIYESFAPGQSLFNGLYITDFSKRATNSFTPASYSGQDGIIVATPTRLFSFGSYVASGVNAHNANTQVAELRNAATQWSNITHTPGNSSPVQPRYVAVEGNNIYALVGSDSTRLWRLNNVETGTPAWAAQTALAAYGSNIGGVVVSGKNGKIYVIGTITAIYDIAGNSWTTGAAPPVSIASGWAICYDGKIYCLISTSATMYVYTISSNSWSAAQATGMTGTKSGMMVRNGRLFTVGGTPVLATRSIDRQAFLAPVTSGEQVLVSKPCNIVSAANAILQSISPDTITTATSTGYLIPTVSGVVTGWKK